MRVELIERWKAHAIGTFWKPCPNCGRMFGGHEFLEGSILWDAHNPGHGEPTCPHPFCKQDVKEKNRQSFTGMLALMALRPGVGIAPVRTSQ